ncbi:MAG TPA: NAD-dependent succinate-semialdehyde dehydrogenase [Rhodanobacteraceae bacterium]
MKFQSINPADDQVVAEYELHTSARMEAIIEASRQAFLAWRERSFADRATLMHKAANVLRDNKATYGELMAREMGKPVVQGEGEAEKCAWVCDYYADNAEAFLAPYDVASGASRSYVTFQPLGPIFAIMPWNYPFWQVFRFAAPHLMAGNTGLLKHAPNVTGCAQAIEDVFHRAGFPQDVFRTLVIDTDQAAAVIANPAVRAVTLTGSTRAGKAVAAAAGKALKKTVLELGGSDPYLVLDDADLDLAIEACAASRLLNSGQSCIGAKRFLVAASLHDAFTAGMVARLGAAKVGDPCARDTAVGPLARHDLRDTLAAQVDASVAAGARCLVGGKVPDGAGCFYPPTVLTGVHPGMPAWDEELFGPVATIIPFKDEDEAVAIANGTPYGLGSAVFSADPAHAERVAARIEAGATFINSHVASDPRLPFGGIKDSGYGRELADHGIREFVNIKTVSIK